MFGWASPDAVGNLTEPQVIGYLQQVGRLKKENAQLQAVALAEIMAMLLGAGPR